MVIIYLYDKVNGWRYRKIGRAYYEQVAQRLEIKAAWLVPGTN